MPTKPDDKQSSDGNGGSTELDNNQTPMPETVRKQLLEQLEKKRHSEQRLYLNLRHHITKAFIGNATVRFDLTDMTAARKRFDAASSNKLKLRIKSVQDTSTDNGIKLRVYRDSVITVKLPVIVYFHGGGFSLGSIESHDSVCRYLAKFTECAVISVEYGLAPESVYPAPVDEGLQVLKWLQQTKDLDFIDVSRVFLAGDSAGGTIALGMATSSKLESVLKGMVLIYPALDPKQATQSMELYATGHFLTKSLLKELWTMYLAGKRYITPTDSALKNLPPILVIAADKDVLRDEGLEFVEKLRSLGKGVEYVCYADMLHGFVQFPKIASSKVKAFQRIGAFISKHQAV